MLLQVWELNAGLDEDVLQLLHAQHIVLVDVTLAEQLLSVVKRLGLHGMGSVGWQALAVDLSAHSSLKCPCVPHLSDLHRWRYLVDGAAVPKCEDGAICTLDPQELIGEDGPVREEQHRGGQGGTGREGQHDGMI